MLIVRSLEQQPYHVTWHAMRHFTQQRSSTTPDELWLVQHDPVFTQGQTGKAQHLLDAGTIPVIKTDRGGQVTYHGPGQQILYPLLDLRRRRLTVRRFINAIEQSVVQTLAHFSIQAYARPEAPGLYVATRKIASLGLRICRGCSLHGVALNINMDLAPFKRINPCGYADLQMIQMVDLVGYVQLSTVQSLWITAFAQQLGDHDIHFLDGKEQNNE